MVTILSAVSRGDCVRARGLVEELRERLARPTDRRWQASVRMLIQACAQIPPPPESPPCAPATNGLSKDAIYRQMRVAQPVMKTFYEVLLLFDAEQATTVTALLEIGPDGAVQKVQTSSEPEATVLARGIGAIIRRISFPPPCGGGVVAVTFPFVLKPAK